MADVSLALARTCMVWACSLIVIELKDAAVRKSVHRDKELQVSLCPFS